MKKQLNQIEKLQKIAGILKESVQESDTNESVSFEMYSEGVYQKWVTDMFEYLEKLNPGFTERDVLDLLKHAQNSLAEVTNENIDTYFRP